jgi:hypothetical protein
MVDWNFFLSKTSMAEEWRHLLLKENNEEEDQQMSLVRGMLILLKRSKLVIFGHLGCL